MTSKKLEDRISQLEKQVKVLQDIEEIKKLQRAYGYYMEHWMSEEIIDCFSDSPDVMLDIFIGKFVGKEGVRKFFEKFLSKEEQTSPELIHQVMQLSGIVDIEADGKTARGRWYGWGAVALPRGGGIEQFYMNGVYEVMYVKENGIWKIKIIQFNRTLTIPPGEGWVKLERITAKDPQKIQPFYPDLPQTIDPSYLTGYIVPFHFKHPVTGKLTTEVERNSSRKIQ